jgi:type I restriction enzyme S subunit
MSEAAINAADLPTSWVLTTLGTVVQYGSTVKAEPNEIADDDWVLELEDIEKDSSRLLQKMTFLQRQSKSTKNRFQTGDVLYGKLRPYLNKVLIADEPGYCTTEILPLKAGAHLDNRYLFYWLKHPAFLKYVEAESHGMNMPRLGTDTGKAAHFALAPRNEQARIANQLDTLLTRVQSCNARFEAIPAMLKRFRQSVLDAAVTGILTKDWRTNLDFQVKEVALRDLGVVSGGVTKNSKRNSLTLTKPYLRVANVHANYLKLGDVTEIGLTPAEYEKTRLQFGDLLIVEGNGSLDHIGRVAMWRSELAECSHQNHLIRWRAGPDALANYVLLWLLSPSGRSQIVAAASSSTGLHTLSVSKVGSLTLRMPSLEEQTEIVRRVEALFALADRIEARCTAARTQAQRLSPLVLAKAFRGDLVPQDPQDEPASVLLERIASQRIAPTAKKQSKNPRQARTSRAPKEAPAMTKSRQDEDVEGKPYLADHLRRLGSATTADVLLKALLK